VHDRLYRSHGDRVIAGVAGGLATWLSVDPSLIRIAWVLLAIFSGGIFVLVYIVMMIVVPLPPGGWVPTPQSSSYPGGGGVPGWGQPWDQGAVPAPGSVPAPGGWPTGQPATGRAQGPAWSPPQPGNAGIVGGAVLILLGAWFLVDQYVHINWDLVWPVIVMVAGGLLIAGAVRRRNG